MAVGREVAKVRGVCVCVCVRVCVCVCVCSGVAQQTMAFQTGSALLEQDLQ